VMTKGHCRLWGPGGTRNGDTPSGCSAPHPHHVCITTSARGAPIDRIWPSGQTDCARPGLGGATWQAAGARLAPCLQAVIVHPEETPFGAEASHAPGNMVVLPTDSGQGSACSTRGRYAVEVDSSLVPWPPSVGP
jgi:hypothetical protein